MQFMSLKTLKFDQVKAFKIPVASRSWLAPLAGLAVLLVTAFASSVRADEVELSKQAFNGSSLVNGTTAFLVRVETGKVQLPQQLAKLADQDTSGALGKFAESMRQPINFVRERMQGNDVFFAVDVPYSSHMDARLQATAEVPEANLMSVARLVWPGQIGVGLEADGLRMIPLYTRPGDVPLPPIGSDLIQTNTKSWNAALNETSDFPVQLTVVLPAYFRETFAEINPELPAAFGGGPAKTLISGIRWISVGIQPESATMRIVIQAESDAIAQEVKNQVAKMISVLMTESHLDVAEIRMMTLLLGMLKPTVNGDQIVLALDDPQESDALIRLATSAATATAKPIASSKTGDNLKQIGLAMHNYYAAFNALPSYRAINGQWKKSGLSWRVHLLPFIGQSDLYNEFRLDEPWDSAHNLRLLDRMPEVFKPVIAIGSDETTKPFHTTYAAVVGEQTVFGRDKEIGFQNITDGLSNTVVVVEVKTADAFPWTSPQDYRFDHANPTVKLRRVDGQVQTLFMDGSVRRIRVDEPASVWNALFSIDGGEVVTLR
ncbi:MAG: DUF1559 domain-containing protein [Planctomycetales bacterium]|nr:DUF1559 domain-containing protein [Planctomycetales bacterium]